MTNPKGGLPAAPGGEGSGLKLGAAFFACKNKKARSARAFAACRQKGGQQPHLGLNRWRIQFNPAIAAWLFDHPVRSRQHVGWNSEADLLRGFKIYY
jgi:hypothetical protein